MDSFKAKHISLSKFLKSPSGKNYFVPTSPIKRKINNKDIGILNKNQKSELKFYSNNYFQFLEKDMPSGCRVRRLSPIIQDKCDHYANKSESPINISKDSKLIPIIETTSKYTQVEFQTAKPKIFLPSIKYVFEN